MRTTTAEPATGDFLPTSSDRADLRLGPSLRQCSSGLWLVFPSLPRSQLVRTLSTQSYESTANINKITLLSVTPESKEAESAVLSRQRYEDACPSSPGCTSITVMRSLLAANSSVKYFDFLGATQRTGNCGISYCGCRVIWCKVTPAKQTNHTEGDQESSCLANAIGLRSGRKKKAARTWTNNHVVLFVGLVVLLCDSFTPEEHHKLAMFVPVSRCEYTNSR